MKEALRSPRAYRFGVFEFDPAAGELRKQGIRIKLHGQPIDILAMLLERPGQIISREEIQKKLWPDGTNVEFEHSLNAAVKRLRDALDDSADTPRYIETLPKRGYRFLAPAEALAPSLAKSKIVRWIALGNVAALALLAALVGLNVGGARDRIFGRATRPLRSVAVLPLANLSGDPEQDYFAEGMTEALITELSKISALRVISRQSMMQYKGTKKSAPQIAKELNVEAIIEGSVLRAGDHVRVSVQLFEAAAERQLWSDSYDRDLRDILAVHGEVAQVIASEIKLTLTPQERRRLTSARPVSFEAYEAYLRARSEWEKRTEDGLKKSLVYFQRAIALEPNYALAYAGLSQSYLVLWDNAYLGPDECVPKARAAALKALQIDDNLAEAHVSLALLLHYYDWNWAGAEREVRRALELSPSSASAHYFYSLCLAHVGRHAEALAEIKKARQLDPLSPRMSDNVGLLLYWARQYDQAIEEMNKAMELRPNDPGPHGIKACAYVRKGMPEEAVAEYLKSRALSPGEPKIPSVLAEGYAMLGQQDRVRKMAKELEGQAATYVRLTEIALVYADLGEKDKAFAWMEKAYETRDSQLTGLKVDPEFDPLRSDPRFQDLLRRMSFPQ